MNQSNCRNLFIRLVRGVELGDKLMFFFKQLFYCKRDSIKFIVALLKFTEFVYIKAFKFLILHWNCWSLFIVQNKFNYSLFCRISLDPWQYRPFNWDLFSIELITVHSRRRNLYINFGIFAHFILLKIL